MLEIAALFFLCNKNKTNAKARGKSGGVAIAYTLGLWFGGEILGVFIGAAISGGEVTAVVYLVALLFAAAGGVASFFIAKSGSVVVQNPALSYPPAGMSPYTSYSNQLAQPQPLNAPYPNQQSQPQPQPLNAPYPNQQPQPLIATYPNQQPQPQPVYAQESNRAQCPHCSAPAAPEFQYCISCGKPVLGMQPTQQPVPIQAYAPPVAAQAQYIGAQAPTVMTQVPPVGAQAPSYAAQASSGTASITFSAKKVIGQFLVSSVTLEINGVPYQAGFNQPINIQVPAGSAQIECYLNYLGKSGIAQTQMTFAPNQSYRIEYKTPMVVTGNGKLNITKS